MKNERNRHDPNWNDSKEEYVQCPNVQMVVMEGILHKKIAFL